MYILQINAVVIEGYVAFMCEDYSARYIYTEYLKIIINIHRSAVIINTKDYPLFFFKDILQISVKIKLENYLSNLFSALSSKISI